MNIDVWLAGHTRSWSRYFQDEPVLDLLLASDVRNGRDMVRTGHLPAADLGEYVSALVGLHAARVVELRDNWRWASQAYRS